MTFPLSQSLRRKSIIRRRVKPKVCAAVGNNYVSAGGISGLPLFFQIDSIKKQAGFHSYVN
jgi:hypothetical protein